MKLRPSTLIEFSMMLVVVGSSLRNVTSAEFDGVVYSALGNFLREAAFPLAIVGFVILLVRFVIIKGDIRANWSAPAVLLLCFQVGLIFRTGLLDEMDVRLVLGLVLQCLIVLIFSIGLPTIRKNGGWLKELTVGAAFACCLYVLENVYEFILNGAATTWKGRFLGLTNHPNFLGVSAAHSCVLLFAFVLDAKIQKRVRFVFGFLALGAGWLVFASGSRTAFISCIFGLLLLAFISGGKKAIRYVFMLSPFLLVGAVIYFSSGTSDYDVNSYRFASTQNTRSETWSALLDNFNGSPFWGVGYQTAGTASSYLRALASSGIFGCVPLAFALVIILAKWCRLVLFVKRNAYDFRFAAIPLLLTTLTGAVTEGYLLDLFTLPLLLFYMEMFSIAYLDRLVAKPIWLYGSEDATSTLRSRNSKKSGHKGLPPVSQ
ncbi:O-antigen ligase family protein [Paraburkholderia sp. SIMBA_030]|uniref:O-antigen ligase family protein n=1 Tax=Paraburkholderia sp. SIMBA_030 TaxID=3085773 RepID=UPI003979ECCC